MCFIRIDTGRMGMSGCTGISSLRYNSKAPLQTCSCTTLFRAALVHICSITYAGKRAHKQAVIPLV